MIGVVSWHITTFQRTRTKTYLGSCQLSIMELFCESSLKTQSQICDEIINKPLLKYSKRFLLREKYSYSEFFWIVFSRILTAYSVWIFSPNAGKYRPEKPLMRIRFLQTSKRNSHIYHGDCRDSFYNSIAKSRRKKRYPRIRVILLFPTL